jgi:hypothetical protein
LGQQGTIDQNDLVLWHDAMDAGDGSLRDFQSAAAIVMSDKRCLIQFQGSIVQNKNAPSPKIWHEQACRHFGLKGVVRLCVVGMIVETSILLQGSESELCAYCDALFASNVSSNVQGMAIPMRVLNPHEVTLTALNVRTHRSRDELIQYHASDVDDFENQDARPQGANYPQTFLHQLERLGSKSMIDGSNLTDEVVPAVQEVDSDTRHARAGDAHSSGIEPGTEPSVPNHLDPASDCPPSSAQPSRSPSLATSERMAQMHTPQKHENDVCLGSEVSPLGTAAQAIYDYESREEDELSIKSGETLHVIARHGDGWCLVQNSQGSFGVVPGNYLEMLEHSSNDVPSHDKAERSDRGTSPHGESSKQPPLLLDGGLQSLPDDAEPLMDASLSNPIMDATWQDPRFFDPRSQLLSYNPSGPSTILSHAESTLRLQERATVEQLLKESLDLTKALDSRVGLLGTSLAASGIAVLKGAPNGPGGNAMLALLSECRKHTSSTYKDLEEIQQLIDAQASGLAMSRWPQQESSFGPTTMTKHSRSEGEEKTNGNIAT